MNAQNRYCRFTPTAIRNLSIVVSVCVAGCNGESRTLEKSLTGQWWSSHLHLAIQSGRMVIPENGIVWASYQIIDGETMQVRNAAPLEMMVTVKFPNTNTMVWYRPQSGALTEWLRFQKSN